MLKLHAVEDFDWLDDSIVVVSLSVGWYLMQRVLMKHVLEPMARRYVKMPKATDGKNNVVVDNGAASKRRPPTPPQDTQLDEYKKSLVKFTNAGFKFFAYTTVLMTGILSLWGDSVMEARRFGLSNNGWMDRGLVSIFEDWPNMQMKQIQLPGHDGNVNSPILFHYQLGLAFYLFSSVMMYFGLDGTPKKDYLAMGIHHAVTSVLIFYSWNLKLFRYGSIIMTVHDLSDPFMEIAKCFLYSGKQAMADLFFALFALVFLVSRLYVFPVHVLYPFVNYLASTEGVLKSSLVPYYQFGPGLLIVLQILHVFWGFLIVKMVVQALFSGKVGDDVREEDDK